MNIKTVEILEKTEVVEGRGRFTRDLDMSANAGIDFLGKGFIRAGQGKVINLMEKEDFVAFVVGRVNGLVMGSGGEVQIWLAEDAVDVFLPEATGFWVAL